jgi:hypothetical protein
LLADLLPEERRIIEWLLPSDKPFYLGVGETLDRLPVLRAEDGSLLFGNYDESDAETVAIGEIESAGSVQPVSLRMNVDSRGALLQLPEVTGFRLGWTLSSWKPGLRGSKGAEIREIALYDETRSPIYTLALSPAERVLWLHHVGSGYNQLLPVTGLLVELARLIKPAASERLTSEQFFMLAGSATDAQLVKALIEYNKRAKKFDASRVITEDETNRRRGGLFNFIRPRR